MAPFDYFVFSVLVLIGTVFLFLRIGSQIKFHVRHIVACLSELNENTMELVLDTIERQPKQDETIKILVGLLLIVGFILLLAVMHAIVGLPV